jgi:MscS family membrane protein
MKKMEQITNIINNIKNIEILQTLIRIILIIIVSKILTKILTSKSSGIKKLQQKINLSRGKESTKNESEFLSKIIKVVINAISIILIIQELGFDLQGLIAGLGIGTVVITLAAQDTAKNLFGGLVIFLDKPFKVGDYIQLSTYIGTVEEISFRSTSIRTLDGTVLHIPNSEVSSVAITNWSELNKRRYITNLTITLDTPLEKVEKVRQEIENMLLNQDEIMKETVSVKFQNILDSGIQVVVIAYTDIVSYALYLELKEKLNYNIMEILEDNKVELAYNTQTIYVKK